MPLEPVKTLAPSVGAMGSLKAVALSQVQVRLHLGKVRSCGCRPQSSTAPTRSSLDTGSSGFAPSAPMTSSAS